MVWNARMMAAWWSNTTHEEEHDVNDDDDEGEEDTTHAIVIVDENESETKNETPERTRTSRTKPQNLGEHDDQDEKKKTNKSQT